MWVFDGEEWTEEGGSSQEKAAPEMTWSRFDVLVPELQVIEITSIPGAGNRDVPPLPMP